MISHKLTLAISLQTGKAQAALYGNPAAHIAAFVPSIKSHPSKAAVQPVSPKVSTRSIHLDCLAFSSFR